LAYIFLEGTRISFGYEISKATDANKSNDPDLPPFRLIDRFIDSWEEFSPNWANTDLVIFLN
jgi:hypothetical protein